MKIPKLLNKSKITKYELWDLYIIKNNKKVGCRLFLIYCIGNVSKLFQPFQFPKNKKCVGIVGLSCKTNCYFEYRIRVRCIEL